MSDRATDIFVSYKAEDRARILPLVKALEAEGFSLWWDARIGGGTNWQEDIEEHLEAAKCVLVAWSKRSVSHEGHFVRDEARWAQRRGVYLPIRLDSVEPPLGFGEIQALPLKGWKGNRSDPRFRAIVNAIRSHIFSEPLSLPDIDLPQARFTRRSLIGVGAGAIAAAGAAGFFFLRPATGRGRRIAVLPFANLSGASDQAYFAQGIAEELRSALTRIGMQVIGRESSDAVKDLDTKMAAAKLGVANILTGSVRRSPDTIRVGAELVSGRDGVERWSQTYDRPPGDVIKIQTDIAASVADALSIALSKTGFAALKLGGTGDSEAEDLFLRARMLFWTGDTADSYRQSIALLGAAVARDPLYADAYQLEAADYEWLASIYPKSPADVSSQLALAERAAKRAIEIVPKLGTAYVTLARIESDRFNFNSALQYARRGFALSPEEPSVLILASLFMQYFGDGRRALELADRAVALDPLKALTQLHRAEVLWYSLRNYSEAIDAARKALDLTPQLSYAHLTIGHCLVMMNRLPEAKAEYGKITADDPLRLTGEAIVAVRSGDRLGAERLIARMRKLFGITTSYQYGQIYAQGGDKDHAFGALNDAVKVKDPGLQALKTDPFIDPLRRDRRYTELLQRLNFPAWT